MLNDEKKLGLLDSIKNEFKKEKEQQLEVKEEISVSNTEVSAKTLRNRAKRQKRKEARNKASVLSETKPILGEPEIFKKLNIKKDPAKETKLLLFKEKFCEDETSREFLSLLDSANNSNDIAYTEEEFLEARMEHETARAVILDPSVDDIALGIGYKWFLVRPLYVDEYMEFVRNFGPRETKPKEFLEFCFQKCFLLPKMTDEQKAEVPSGTMLTLYRTILDISDFNKKYRIIEV